MEQKPRPILIDKPTIVDTTRYKGAPHPVNFTNFIFGLKMVGSLLDRRKTREFRVNEKEELPQAAVRALELNTKTHTLPSGESHTQIEAGNRHFHATWVMDHAKSMPALVALAQEGIATGDGKRVTSEKITMDLLAKQVIDLVELSCANSEKTVYTGVRSRDNRNLEGVDIPHDRADSLPALIYNIKLLQDAGRDLFAEIPSLESKLNTFLETYIEKYTLGIEKAYIPEGGDWVDTVRRKYPTWNIVWQTKMVDIIEAWGGKDRFASLKDHPTFTASNMRYILMTEYMHNGKEKPNGDKEVYLVDYLGKDVCSTDANVLALNLGIFNNESAWVTTEIVKALESRAELFDQYPMRMIHIPYREQGLTQSKVAEIGAPMYHSVTWPHMGSMYVTGLLQVAEQTQDPKRKDFLIQRATTHLQSINTCIERFGFAETIEWREKRKGLMDGVRGRKVDSKENPGRLYTSLLIRSENPLTMFAANYLGIFAQAEKMGIDLAKVSHDVVEDGMEKFELAA